MPKETGRRGAHIWIPVASGYAFDDTRDWVEAASRSVVGDPLAPLVGLQQRLPEVG